MKRTVDCDNGRHWPRCKDEECSCLCHTSDADDAKIDRLELEIMYGRKPRP